MWKSASRSHVPSTEIFLIIAPETGNKFIASSLYILAKITTIFKGICGVCVCVCAHICKISLFFLHSYAT